MNIKVIAIDLDGTLLDDAGVFPEENKKMIRRALDAGCCVVPTTGRSFRNAKYEVFKAFDDIPYYINANGTVVTDGITEEILFTKGFPAGVAGEVYRLCKKYETYIEPYAGPYAYMERSGIPHLYHSGIPDVYCEKLMRTNILCEDMERVIEGGEYPVSKIHIVCARLEEKEKLMEEIGAIPGLYPISVLKPSIEVVYEKISKRDGLVFLCDHLGVTREEVMVLGDSNNDLEMMQWAEHSVAMGNASQRIKDISKYETDSNNDSGVAKALQRFLNI